ncbi:hypothetical protein [Pelagibius marinus]|uniref:hypothetical protein n=1 Tax=Pelagibius marinus TaxID=2762760 RepID=UPI0018730B68|nr:hypothetical protein [Pelagibius marinus]
MALAAKVRKATAPKAPKSLGPIPTPLNLSFAGFASFEDLRFGSHFPQPFFSLRLEPAFVASLINSVPKLRAGLPLLRRIEGRALPRSSALSPGL